MGDDFGYNPHEPKEWKRINKAVQKAKRRIRNKKTKKESGGGCAVIIFGILGAIMTGVATVKGWI